MVLALRTEFDKARKDVQAMRGELAKLDAKGKATKNSFSSGFSDLIPSKAMVGMMAATAAATVLSKSVGELMAREDALADFSAITGVTGEKLGEFGDAAVALSNKFGTGVVENIEVFKGVLSRLGPDFASSSDAVKSMGDSINTLAKASGLDATASMDALTTAMLQFGVDLSDPMAAAGEAAEMMNIMAAGAKEGAAEIPQISEALKQVGVTADALNISFSETNAALQVLAAGGKNGSEAGVALRNVMVSLTKGTKETDKALAKIGLSTEQLGKVMTEEGLEEAFKLFNKQLETMPGLADQAALKATVFGKENLAAAGIVLKGADAIGELNGKITDTNTAYDQAAIKMETSSEKLKRSMNSAWNDIVGGVGKAGEGLAGAFNRIFTGMEQAADSIGKLIRLDLAGFWETATTSVDEYNSKKEKQLQLEEKNYRLLMQQEDKRIKETGNRKKLLDLQNELVGALKDVEKITDSKALVKHMDAFKEMFNKGTINSVDEYFLALKGGSSSASDETEKTGKKVKTLADIIKEKYDQGEQGVLMRRLFGEAQPRSATEALNEIGLRLQSMRPDLDIKPVAETPIDWKKIWDTDGLEQVEEMLDSNIFGMAANAATSAADAIGGALAGAEGGWKDALKSILSQMISFVQVELLAAEAAAAIRALFTAGVSLTLDGALAALAYGALEIAKGAVNSFRTGIAYVPNDQIAMLHKGERVQSAEEVNSQRRGNRKSSGKMHVSNFRLAVDDYYLTAGRSVR
jgi:TP901 family phage tail tape measure protein